MTSTVHLSCPLSQLTVTSRKTRKVVHRLFLRQQEQRNDVIDSDTWWKICAVTVCDIRVYGLEDTRLREGGVESYEFCGVCR